MGLTWFEGVLAKVAILVGREQGRPAALAVQGCNPIWHKQWTESLEFLGSEAATGGLKSSVYILVD